MKRITIQSTPLLAIVAPLIAGIALGVQHSLGQIDNYLIYIVFSIAIISGVVFDIVFKRYLLLVCALFLAAGFSLTLASYDTTQIKYDTRIEVVSKIESTPRIRGRWQTFDAKVIKHCDSTGQWHNENCKIQLSIDTAMRHIRIGDIVRAESRMRRIEGSYGENMLHRGIIGRFYGYNVQVIGRDSSWFTSFYSSTENYRGLIADKIYALDTAQQGATALMSALTVGERSEMSRDLTSAYRRAGTAHLLSISGLHVGIIFTLLNFLFGGLRLLKRGRIIFGTLVILLLWGYAIFSGMSPAVLRSTIMFTLFQIAIISSTSATSLNILSFSALILLLINPLYIYDIGFQLSYVAMIGITMLYAPIRAMLNIRNRVLGALWSVTAISLAAQIAVAPIVAYHFGQIPLMGIVLGIAVWITVPIIIIGTMAFLATNIVWIGSITLIVSTWQNSIMEFVSSKSWVTLDGIRISLPAMWVIYVVLTIAAVYANNIHERRLRRDVLRSKYNI